MSPCISLKRGGDYLVTIGVKEWQAAYGNHEQQEWIYGREHVLDTLDNFRSLVPDASSLGSKEGKELITAQSYLS